MISDQWKIVVKSIFQVFAAKAAAIVPLHRNKEKAVGHVMPA